MSDTLSADSGRSAAVEGGGWSDGATDPVLSAEGLTKTYGSGEETVRAVDDLSISIERVPSSACWGPTWSATASPLLVGAVAFSLLVRRARRLGVMGHY